MTTYDHTVRVVHHALTATIIESGIAPPQHPKPPLPADATSLIVLHDAGVNAMLQPFVIAVPPHVFPTVLIVPTFVLLQYTSHAP